MNFIEILSLKNKEFKNSKEKQQSKYDQYLDDVNDENTKIESNCLTFIMGYGLVVIASASLSSAVLAIERNLGIKNNIDL